MYTHSNKQDRNLITEEKWFEEDIIQSRRIDIGPSTPNRRRTVTSDISQPVVSELLIDIVTYLECNQIGDLSDALDYNNWLYEDAVHKTVGKKTYSTDLYLDNHREAIVEVWYKWIGCLYRYHPNIFRILTQLDIVDTELYFSAEAGHFCREEEFWSSDIRSTIRKAEGAIKAIAYNSLRAHTSEEHTLNHLEYELFRIQETVQFNLEETLSTFHVKYKKSFSILHTSYDRTWRDSPVALRELAYVHTKLVIYRRSF